MRARSVGITRSRCAQKGRGGWKRLLSAEAQQPKLTDRLEAGHNEGLTMEANQDQQGTGGAGSVQRNGSAHPSGGPEVWNVVAWGDVRGCRTTESVIKEVREALELGCRTISVERQGAPNSPSSATRRPEQ